MKGQMTKTCGKIKSADHPPRACIEKYIYSCLKAGLVQSSFSMYWSTILFQIHNMGPEMLCGQKQTLYYYSFYIDSTYTSSISICMYKKVR